MASPISNVFHPGFIDQTDRDPQRRHQRGYVRHQGEHVRGRASGTESYAHR